MQHRYKSDLFVVGGQGRLFVERALGVFIPAAALASETRMHLNIKDKIDLMEKNHYASKEVVAACHKLRLYGNRTDHDEGDDLKPEEKPDVIKNVFIVAKALLNKVSAPDNVETSSMRGAMHDGREAMRGMVAARGMRGGDVIHGREGMRDVAATSPQCPHTCYACYTCYT